MPKRNVTITLSADQIDALQTSFARRGTSKTLADEELQVIVSLAVASWVDQFSGRKRYRSLTEQHVDWLTGIYSQILADEEPSEVRLFSRLSFPYGQALYLARVVREQHQGTWRRKALMSLRDALKGRLEDAKKWVKDGRGEERMTFTLSKGSRVELVSTLSLLAEQETPGLSPVRPEGSMGSYSYVSITAANIEPILNEVEETLGAAS